VLFKKQAITVRYRFEKGPLDLSCNFEHLFEAASKLIQKTPGLVSDLPFGTASKLSDGMFSVLTGKSGLGSKKPQAHENLRLKAIEASAGTILENTYDSAGHLSETAYPDGTAVRYRYDHQGRVTTVFSGKTGRIDYEYDGRGRCLKASYGLNPRLDFAYQWLEWRIPSLVSFPEGSLRHIFDNSGVITSFEDSQSWVAYDRASDGSVFGVRVRMPNGRLGKVSLSSGSYQVVQEEVTGREGTATVLSPMGVHTIDKSGRVYSWLNWDGNLIKFFYHPNGRVHQIWSRRGLATLDYTIEGRIHSLLRPNGRRYVWYGEGSSGSFLLLNPGGASLWLFDRQGRIRSISDSWGSSVAYNYGLLNIPKLAQTVSSPQWGKLDLSYGKNYSLNEVRLNGKGQASLSYGGKGELRTVTCNGDNPRYLAEVLHLTGWLYCLRSAGKEAYKDTFMMGPLLT
jgi:YD repeat-containing protein